MTFGPRYGGAKMADGSLARPSRAGPGAASRPAARVLRKSRRGRAEAASIFINYSLCSTYAPVSSKRTPQRGKLFQTSLDWTADAFMAFWAKVSGPDTLNK